MTSIKLLDNDMVRWWTSVPLAQNNDYLLYKSQIAGISSFASEASNLIQVPLTVILYLSDRYLQTRKIRIKLHQMQQCFSNKIKPLHVSANDGHHRKATNTSKEMRHVYHMHVVMYGLHWDLK
jgi:hypothetical protein